jgi:hypothetical protein
MNLASDLMGLGSSPLLALRTSNGGNGPVTISAAGTTFATATRIQSSQYFVSCTNAGGSGGAAVALPVVGGDNGALIADDFVINNATATQSLTVFASTGVAISVGGTNTSSTTIPVHTTMTLYPLTTTQWLGVKGS